MSYARPAFPMSERTGFLAFCPDLRRHVACPLSHAMRAGALVALVLCASGFVSAAQTEGTRRMAARLAELAKKNEADPTPFANLERLALLRAAPVPTTVGDRWRYDL